MNQEELNKIIKELSSWWSGLMACDEIDCPDPEEFDTMNRNETILEEVLGLLNQLEV